MRILALALFATAPLASLSAQVVDQQNQGFASVYFSDLNFSDVTGTTFTPAATTVTGAGLFAVPWGGTTSGTLTVQFWTNLTNQPGATMLASGTTALGNQSGWADVFWSPITVTPETSYFLTFTTNTDYRSLASWGPGVTARGQAYYNNQSIVCDTTYYLGNENCALGFREYAADVNTTPEPSSMALLGTGLFGLIPMVRRKK